MAQSIYPAFLSNAVLSNEDALKAVVKSGTILASGFGPSEPHTFYDTLWDHIQRENIVDLDIRNAFFMAPHRLCLGDTMHSKGMLNGLASGEAKIPGMSLFAPLAQRINAVSKKVEGLKKLTDHYAELKERRIVFTSPFISPVTNIVLPTSAMVKALYPDLAGRNTTRMGITDMHPVHFCDAVDALGYDADDKPRVHLAVMVMTPPNEQGLLSHGISNGANQDILEKILAKRDMNLLLYLNPKYPFTDGYGDARNGIHVDDLKPLADAGRLFVVQDDGILPALPADSFKSPLPQELAIAEHVVNHIEANLRYTQGRTIQVGFGGTGVLAMQKLKESSWTGRHYSEMLETFTFDLFNAGKIAGTHFIRKDGTRENIDGKMMCTFAMGEHKSDFYDQLDHNQSVIMASASRVVIPEGFYGGLGINNCLGIDFNGHINAFGRYENYYSGIGGLGMIMRGLAKGGIGYLCMKSTHHNGDGKLRSSVFPMMPKGTPIGITGSDIMGGREGTRFFLVTEHGVAQISGVSQSRLVNNLISVADPQFRDWLRDQAYTHYRIRV